MTPLTGRRNQFARHITRFEWDISRGSSLEVARTAAVNMLVFSELLYLFNMRRLTASVFTRDTFAGNPVPLRMAALSIGLQFLLTYTAPMKQIFQTAALDA